MPFTLAEGGLHKAVLDGTDYRFPLCIYDALMAKKETSGGQGKVLHADLDPTQMSLHPEAIEELIGTEGQLAKWRCIVSVGPR